MHSICLFSRVDLHFYTLCNNSDSVYKKDKVLSCYFIFYLVALIGLNLDYIEDYMRRVESS